MKLICLFLLFLAVVFSRDLKVKDEHHVKLTLYPTNKEGNILILVSVY